MPPPAQPEPLEEEIGKLVGPGGQFELGMDTWPCGNAMTTGLCFVQGPRTLKDLYDMSFAAPGVAEREFIVYENERYTFGEVLTLVQACAHGLQKQLGIAQGDRVGICMRNLPEWVITFLAVTYAGGVVVPLNGWWGTSELEYGISDSGTKVLICDKERLESARPFAQRLDVALVLANGSDMQLQASKKELHFGQLLVSGATSIGGNPEQFRAHGKRLLAETHDCQAFSNSNGSLTQPDINHDSHAGILYTSGTTGHPKGVVLTHRSMVNQMNLAVVRMHAMAAVAERAGAPAEPLPCVLAPVPLFHVTGTMHIMLSALVQGAKLVLMPKWDAGKALRLIHDEKPTFWTGVPTMVQDLLSHPELHKFDLSSLKSVGGGGAPTPVSQVRKVSKKFASSAPTQGYGLTETSGAIAVIAGPEYEERPTSTGQPFPIVSACVVDPEATLAMAKPLPAGERGELLLKSPLIMSHYWNKPQQTAENIITLSEEHGGHGWFRTGDVAKIDEDGYIHILDRVKDMIIRGGENISCAEVESAAFEFDSVLECAAFGIKNERLGEVVGLAVLPKQGMTLDIPALIATMKARLAKFKLPTETDVFLMSEALPRGATGKILKRVLRDSFASAKTVVGKSRL